MSQPLVVSWIVSLVMIKVYYLVLTLKAAGRMSPRRMANTDGDETDGQAGTPRRMVQTDVSETEGRVGCPRDGKPRGMVQTVVPHTEGRDGGPRSGRPRRMPEMDVPETEGINTCAWDKWYRPVSLRRSPGRAAEDVSVREIFGPEGQGGRAWDWTLIRMAQTEA